MSTTTPRQVLYGLVAGGFLVVTAVLAVGTALAGIVPAWWSLVLGVVLAAVGIWMAFQWRRTAVALLLSIGCFLAWMVGTLTLSGS